MKDDLSLIKNDLVTVGRRMYERNYIASNDGNISARLDKNRVVITPSGVSKGFMKPEEMVVIDMEGKVQEGHQKPSSELLLHLHMYKNRTDINSVCHAHPVYATAFAVAGIPLDKYVLPEVIISLGTIPLIEYGTPGTEELYKPILKKIDQFDAFLLANHGVLTLGKNIISAYHKMETVEHFARIAFISQQLGHTSVLNKEQVKKLLDQRQKFGFQKNFGGIDIES